MSHTQTSSTYSTYSQETSISLEVSSPKGEPETSSGPSKFFLVFIALANLICSVLMNIMLKSIVSKFTFPLVVFTANQIAGLTVTLYVVYIAQTSDQQASIPLKEKLIAGFLFTVSVPVSLWSLRYNTFTNNQIYKILTMPFIAIGANIFLGKNIDVKSAMSLFCIMLSSIVAVGANSLELTFGVIPGICTITVTCLQQLYSQHLGSKYEVNGMHYISQTTPVTVVISSIFALISIFYDPSKFFDQVSEDGVILKILLSSVVAIFLNLTAFSMMTRVSALYFQLVGLGKTLSLMTADGLLGYSQFTFVKLAAMYSCMICMLMYSYFRKAIEDLRVIGGVAFMLVPLFLGISLTSEV
eukprot:TRINITY_DN11213_c0_g1_i1.p1 TRINITY_DN11213_c0_g1~~TRINITY_DN11213_c0_g1_i1.p1  ORF type:complete len:356 (+),score=65.28 TRINITY_DN11213_c0_g1_i1:72-1139(+)